MTEIIIPLNKRGGVAPAWAQMVDHGAFDCLVNVDAGPDAAERAERQLGLPLVQLRHIDRSGPSQWSVHPANLAESLPKPNAPLMATSSDAPLWEVASAGDLTDEHLADLQDPGFARRPRSSDEIGRAQLERGTLLDRGLEQFGEHHISGGGGFPGPTVLWITKPNSLTDCVWFWNCRALRPLTFSHLPMYLLPHRGMDQWVGFATAFGSLLARSEDIEPDVVLHSMSVKPLELEVLASSFALEVSTGRWHFSRKFPPPPPRDAPFTYGHGDDVRDFVLFKRRYGRTSDAVIHVGTSSTLLRCESPVEFVGSGRVLVRIASSAFDHLPKIPTTASMVLQNADWSGEELQLRTNAMSRYHFELRIPEMEAVVWAVLQAATVEGELSDKGRLAHRVEAISKSSAVFEPDVLGAVRELTTQRSKELKKELAQLRRDGHDDVDLVELASSWGGRTQRRHRSSGDLRSQLGSEADGSAELLTAEGWAERGAEIRCDQCTIRSFVPLQDAAGSPICPACSAEQEFERSPSLSIYYRLNGLIDRASDQGVLPHLMAQAALLKRDPRTRLLLGVDVRFGDGHGGEVDLFGLHGGKVVAGEAKTSPAEFSSDQLHRDVELSHRLRADTHLLASPNPVDDDAVKLAGRLAHSRGMRLLVIEGHNVREPDDDLYEDRS